MNAIVTGPSKSFWIRARSWVYTRSAAFIRGLIAPPLQRRTRPRQPQVAGPGSTASARRSRKSVAVMNRLGSAGAPEGGGPCGGPAAGRTGGGGGGPLGGPPCGTPGRLDGGCAADGPAAGAAGVTWRIGAGAAGGGAACSGSRGRTTVCSKSGNGSLSGSGRDFASSAAAYDASSSG